MKKHESAKKENKADSFLKEKNQKKEEKTGLSNNRKCKMSDQQLFRAAIQQNSQHRNCSSDTLSGSLKNQPLLVFGALWAMAFTFPKPLYFTSVERSITPVVGSMLQR